VNETDADHDHATPAQETRGRQRFDAGASEVQRVSRQDARESGRESEREVGNITAGAHVLVDVRAPSLT